MWCSSVAQKKNVHLNQTSLNPDYNTWPGVQEVKNGCHNIIILDKIFRNEPIK